MDLFTVYLEDWDLSIWDGNLDAYMLWSNMRQWCWFRDGVLLMMRWMCLPLLVLIICWEISLHFKDDLLNTWSSLFVWTVLRSFNNMCGEWVVPISVILLSVILKLSGWLAARWLWRCSSSPFCSSRRRDKISSQILQQQEQGLTTSICILLAFNKI
jgi:hypothetical protein